MGASVSGQLPVTYYVTSMGQTKITYNKSSLVVNTETRHPFLFILLFTVNLGFFDVADSYLGNGGVTNINLNGAMRAYALECGFDVRE